jgi:hypothetical protein
VIHCPASYKKWDKERPSKSKANKRKTINSWQSFDHLIIYSLYLHGRYIYNNVFYIDIQLPQCTEVNCTSIYYSLSYPTWHWNISKFNQCSYKRSCRIYLHQVISHFSIYSNFPPFLNIHFRQQFKPNRIDTSKWRIFIELFARERQILKSSA